MIAVRSITFGDVVSVTYAEPQDVRDFAMVHRTLVLDPAKADEELLDAVEQAIRALVVDVLEDISLTEPMDLTPVQDDEEDPDDPGPLEVPDLREALGGAGAGADL